MTCSNVESELQGQAVGLDRGYVTLPVNREKYRNGSVATRKFQCFLCTGGEKMKVDGLQGVVLIAEDLGPTIQVFRSTSIQKHSIKCETCHDSR
jgi:hypothetical protein